VAHFCLAKSLLPLRILPLCNPVEALSNLICVLIAGSSFANIETFFCCHANPLGDATRLTQNAVLPTSGLANTIIKFPLPIPLVAVCNEGKLNLNSPCSCKASTILSTSLVTASLSCCVCSSSTLAINFSTSLRLLLLGLLDILKHILANSSAFLIRYIDFKAVDTTSSLGDS